MKRAALYKVGISLIILSFVLWIVPIVTPFLPVVPKVKAVIATGAIIVAEVIFWIGAIIVGKEAAMKIKGYINPKNWKKKQSHLYRSENNDEA